MLGVRNANVGVVRFAACFAIVGVIANRFTVSMFAFNWQLPHREFFYWKEVLIIGTILCAELLVYRWIVNRLPVHKEHPRYRGTH